MRASVLATVRQFCEDDRVLGDLVLADRNLRTGWLQQRSLGRHCLPQVCATALDLPVVLLRCVWDDGTD